MEVKKDMVQSIQVVERTLLEIRLVLRTLRSLVDQGISSFEGKIEEGAREKIDSGDGPS